MTKKLDITSITNELEESAFFPSKKKRPDSPTPQSAVQEPAPATSIIPATRADPQRPERANVTVQQHPSNKRIITRNSFEIYEDQMDSLRKLSFQEKMDGKLGSMSGMVERQLILIFKNENSDK